MAYKLIDKFYCPSAAPPSGAGQVSVYLDESTRVITTDSTAYNLQAECAANRSYAEGDIITSFCVDGVRYNVRARSSTPFAFVGESYQDPTCSPCKGSMSIQSIIHETKRGLSDGYVGYAWVSGLTNRVWRLDGNIYTFPVGEEGKFRNLAAGGHNVVLTYGDGCKLTSLFVINPGVSVHAVTLSKADASKNGVCDGTITTTVTGGNGPFTYEWNDGFTTQHRTGLCAGTYTVIVKDVDGIESSASITINQPGKEAAPAEQILYVSPALSLRFIPDILLSSNEPVTIDNTLYNEFYRPGEKKNCYNQKFRTSDLLPLQALSNYSDNVIEVVDIPTESVIHTVDMMMVAQFSNLSETFNGYIKRHSATETRIYFGEVGDIPVPVGEGDSVELLNTQQTNGIYQLISVGKETNGTEYLIIKQEYTEATATTECQITTYFNQRNYNAWEGALNFAFIPEGDYQVRIKGSDNRGESAWKSEPIAVRKNHPGTVLMQYRNSKNKHDIYYSAGFTNHIRFEATMINGQSTTEKELHREPSRVVTLRSDFRKKMGLNTYALPPYLHERIEAALALDNIVIDGTKYISEEGYTRGELMGRTLLANGSAILEQEGYATFMKGSGVNVDGGGGVISINDEGFLRY